MGDSTTYGALDLEMGGWANRLHVAMLNEARGFDDSTLVVNRALPGYTLSTTLRNAKENMKYFRSIGHTTAVLQAGMNEVKIHRHSTTPLVPARLFGEQIARFCSIAFEQDCAPILVGPPPIDTTRDTPTFSGAVIKDELLVEYGEIMRGVADRMGIPYIDTRKVFADTGGPLQELLAPDGYHPNALGHAVLAAEVYNALPRDPAAG